MTHELFAVAERKVAFRDTTTPPVGDRDIRVRCRFAAAKHGTEMAFYKGYAAPRGSYDPHLKLFDRQGGGVKFPVPLGNTCIGEVVEAGAGVTRFRVGDSVFGYGSFREEHVWSEDRCRALPVGVPWQAAACLDPAEFAVGAVRDGHVRIGDAVAVFGLGAIGLFAVQFARIAGAHPIIAVDPVASRRDLAVGLGADIAFDPSGCDAGREIKLGTGNRGVDVSIEYSGNAAALGDALRGTAYGGTIVAGAYPPAYPAGLDFGAEAHMNRLRIVFSRACSEPNPDHPNWDENRVVDVAWRLLRDGVAKAIPIVSPIVRFDDLPTEYPKIESEPERYLKLGVELS